MKKLVITVIMAAVPAITHAETDPKSDYDFIAQNTAYSEACSRSGASPLSTEQLEKLQSKLKSYAARKQIPADWVAARTQVHRIKVGERIEDGWLDARSCYQIREMLLKNLNDPAFLN